MLFIFYSGFIVAQTVNITSVSIDNFVNALEETSVDVSGTSDLGGGVTVTVTIGTATGMANTAPDGSWIVSGIDISGEGLSQGTNNASADGGGAPTANFNFEYDTVLPSDPGVAPDLTAGTDLGTTDTDNITSDNTPDFAGSGTDGEVVALNGSLDGMLGSTTIAGGTWTITSAILSDGPQNISYTITDVAGNTSAGSSPTLSITIDTGLPANPGVAPDLTTGTDLGTLSTDNITSNNTPDFTGSGTDGEVVTLNGSVDGLLGTAIIAGGIWTITSGTLSDGPQDISYTITDVAGNTSAGSSPNLSVTIDTGLPTDPGVAPDMTAGTDLGISNADNITSDNTPDFTGSGTDGEVVTLNGSIDGQLGIATIASGAWTITSAIMSDGPQDISYTITDVAGNTSAGSSPALSTIIDTVSPFVIDDLTLDTDDDGDIDALELQFNENINDGTVVAGDFSLSTDAGVSNDQFSSNATGVTVLASDPDGNDDFIRLNLATPANVAGTGLGQYNYNQTTVIEDVAGNSMGDFGFISANDGASPVILSHSLEGSNNYLEVTFSEGLYTSGGAALTSSTGEFDENFLQNTGTATNVIIDEYTQTDDVTPTAAGDNVIRFQLSTTGVADGNETIELTPLNGASVYDNASPGNPMDVSQTTGVINLNSINAADVITFISATPSFDNSFIVVEFSRDVDRASSTGTDDPLRIQTSGGSPELRTQNYAANGGATMGNVGGQTMVDAAGAAQSTGIFWRFNPGTITGTPRGVETFEVYPRDGTEVYGSVAPNLGMDQDEFIEVTLADQFQNDFDNATATAYDIDGDGNIDEVEIVMPDGIDDVTITETDFTFNAVVADVASFDTGLTPDDNTFSITFSGYTGTTVVGTLDYTPGTLRDDAAATTWDGTQGNLFLAGSISPADAAGPVAISATTSDNNLNGQIDEIDIVFSEEITEVTTVIAANFTLVSPVYAITGVAVGTNNAVLTITESGATDTEVRPIVTIAGSIVQDASMAQNPAQAYGQADDGTAAFARVDALTTNDISPAITGTIDDGTANVLVAVDDNTIGAINNGDGTWTLPDDSFTATRLGTFEVVLTTIDGFANVGTDISGPELTINGGILVTPANPVSSCNGTLSYETLSEIRLVEDTDGSFGGSGSIILSLPAGFEFNTSAFPDFVTNSSLSDITVDLETGIDPEQTEFIGTASLSIELDYDGADNGIDDLRINGLEVRAVGSTVRTNVNMIRSGGTNPFLTLATSYGNFSSNAQPTALNSLDETLYADSDIAELAIREALPFSLSAADQAPTLVNWYEGTVDGSAEFSGTIATNLNLNSSVGLHTYQVVDDNGLCESNPLTFNLLLYNDDDPLTGPVDSTFVSQAYSIANDVDTIYLSNPVNHTVVIIGAGTTVTNPESPDLLILFNPSIAGVGTHPITYQVTNDVTGQTMSVTETMTVNALTEFFNEAPQDECDADFPFNLTLDLSPYGTGAATDLVFRRFRFFERITGGSGGSGLIADTDIGTTYPWAIPFNFEIADLSPVSAVDDGFGTITPGEGTVILVERYSTDPVLGSNIFEYDNIFIYGEPDVNLTNVNAQYCREDAAFTLQRNLRYVTSFTEATPGNEFTFWDRNYQIEASQDITNGYQLLKWNGLTFLLYEDFTGISNEFDPSDPNQNLDTDEDESGLYRIIYTTEDLTPANCAGTYQIDFVVNAPAATPVLDLASTPDGGFTGFTVNGTPDPFVEGNEYTLEYCVGNALGSGFITSETNQVRWYDSNFNEIIAFRGNTTLPPAEIGLATNGVNNRFSAEQSIEFYFTALDLATGCESDFRKVNVAVYVIPDAPILSNTEASEPTPNNYVIDFCEGDTYIDLDFDDLSGFTNAQYFASLNYWSDVNANTALVPPTSTVLNTGLGAGDDINLNSGPFMIVGAGRYEYQIVRRENTSGSSNFNGCMGGATTVSLLVNPIPAPPTVADFVSLGTTTLHVCEGDAFADIRFQNTGIDEYVFYDTDGMTEIARISSGETVDQGTIELQSVFSNFDTSTPGVYDFQITRISGANGTTRFTGCESTATTFTIEVHNIDQADIPVIGSSDYSDLDTGDPDLYDYAVCIQNLIPTSTLTATSTFAGPKEFVWYEVDNLNGDNPVEILVANSPTFDQLGMGLGDITFATTRFFEVTQRTDTDDFSSGNACEIPAGSIISIDFADQGALTVNLPGGPDYCYDDTNLTLDLLVSLMPAGNANVNYAILIEGASDTLDLDPGIGQTLAFGAGNPTTDFIQWHEAAGGTAVGGSPTSHDILFEYTDPITACTGALISKVTIHPLPDIDVTFDGLTGDNLEFCYDDGLVSLGGINSASGLGLTENTGIFSINTSGLGTTNNNISQFDPSDAHDNFHGGPGPFATQSVHTITFTYTDEFGCQNSIDKNVLVNPRPEVVGNEIQALSACATETVELVAQLAIGLDVNDFTFDWYINGGFAQSISDNNSFFTNIDGSANLRVDVLNDVTGCQVTIETPITVGAEPIPAFSYVGITEGRTTNFLITEDNPALNDADINELIFEVVGQSVTTLTAPVDIISFPVTIDHVFPNSGTYDVNLTLRSVSGCDITITRQVNIIDHFNSFNGSNAYTESFEASTGGWTVETLSPDGKTNNLTTSWTRSNTVSGSIDGSFAFITDNYLPEEISFVYSPSFDLTGFSSPTISFLRLVQFETFRDGVVFQVSTDDGRTWVNVGSFDPLLGSTPGWYNKEGISAGPGATAPGPQAVAANVQQLGWADKENMEWTEAFSTIEVANANYVRFRFALAAQAGSKSVPGFGFDFVRIYDRDQIVLLEQFSSTLNLESVSVNTDIQGDVAFSGTDVIRINYFTDLSNDSQFADEINLRNKVDPGAKSAFYGIVDVPSISISGSPFDLDISDPSYLISMKSTLQNAKLRNPEFLININAAVTADNYLNVDADFEALSDFNSDSELSLNIAVLEPEIILTEATGLYNAGESVYNVLRVMLPDAAGQYVSGPILQGDILQIQNLAWEITNMRNTDSIAVVAFVQDLNTKEIYQAEALGINGIQNALGIDDLSGLSVYPNPADRNVTIEFERSIEENNLWVLYDQTGREVLKGSVEKGAKTLTIDTKEVIAGVYLISISNDTGNLKVARVMIAH